MKLSPRLLGIATFVKNHSIVADIGTDHGYIPAYLIEKNISKKVIANDISKGSLKKAEEIIEELGYEENIEARLGNGLEVLKPFEADTVIIAGMGGPLIIDIIKSNAQIAETINDFILQPMIAADELRRYLYNNNFKIIDEKIIKEGDKHYEIIYAKHGKDCIEDEIYYELSKILVDKRDLQMKEYIQYKIKKTENILEKLDSEESEKAVERKKELIEKLGKYKEVLRCYESF
ncbi:tRNA (adenine(22)-N(1))-methyltransferase [Sporanaerobacter acetigenes]|uniref:tRNA (Adenine22-N1)-methyltransferase n=1 Tax=Sporanaerobacter acetigenes DSM 13106 TaxID=1123281 RepID=A0A1M5UP75_9FIRM|nr:class I SAM-dependent methyltransferase [Sporanaerobacter acetigenes]SHH64872.1 tRNA (adenine22-N1)-methyltransferase [Sporanaerobacter acetigenes DSM 13106]